MSSNNNPDQKMVHQIKVKMQAPVPPIKMVQFRRLWVVQGPPLLLEEVEGVVVAQPWELTNGVGRGKIIMLVFYYFPLGNVELTKITERG